MSITPLEPGQAASDRCAAANAANMMVESYLNQFKPLQNAIASIDPTLQTKIVVVAISKNRQKVHSHVLEVIALVLVAHLSNQIETPVAWNFSYGLLT